MTMISLSNKSTVFRP